MPDGVRSSIADSGNLIVLHAPAAMGESQAAMNLFSRPLSAAYSQNGLLPKSGSAILAGEMSTNLRIWPRSPSCPPKAILFRKKRPFFAPRESAHRQLPATISGVSANAMKTGPDADHLKKLIREVPDFPKPGINFYDITTLLKDKLGFAETIEALQQHYRNLPPIDVVVGIEARGYFFAPAVAHALGAGFVPVRKPKKLPHTVRCVEYDLEYGTDKLEMHADAIVPGQSVLIIDDVLATGGTASAVARLVEMCEGKVAGLGFVIELSFLNGRQKLIGFDVFSLLQY
jgi:adenine phosphoribosyltransferase